MPLWEHELKNAYIGEVWTPWSNTLSYFPFAEDQLDHVGNSSISTTGTQQTLWYRFSSSGEITISTPPSTCKFMIAWVKYNNNENTIAQFWWTYNWFMLYNFKHAENTSYERTFQVSRSSSSYYKSNQQSTTTWTWYCMAMWGDTTAAVGYINWVNVWNRSWASWYTGWNSIRFWYGINMDVSNYILESQLWTAQQVKDFYNLTCETYWLQPIS